MDQIRNSNGIALGTRDVQLRMAVYPRQPHGQQETPRNGRFFKRCRRTG